MRNRSSMSLTAHLIVAPSGTAFSTSSTRAPEISDLWSSAGRPRPSIAIMHPNGRISTHRPVTTSPTLSLFSVLACFRVQLSSETAPLEDATSSSSSSSTGAPRRSTRSTRDARSDTRSLAAVPRDDRPERSRSLPLTSAIRVSFLSAATSSAAVAASRRYSRERRKLDVSFVATSAASPTTTLRGRTTARCDTGANAPVVHTRTATAQRTTIVS
mmetsp:Transcript_13446/g.40662  ORF Transcript_13446/g.40662 Transcript_13446/m.40662 type:complete len:215 (-) Transcript_13446:29-673(-)